MSLDYLLLMSLLLLLLFVFVFVFILRTSYNTVGNYSQANKGCCH